MSIAASKTCIAHAAAVFNAKRLRLAGLLLGTVCLSSHEGTSREEHRYLQSQPCTCHCSLRRGALPHRTLSAPRQ